METFTLHCIISIVFFLGIIYILYKYVPIIEQLTNTSRIILIGDSVLNNSNYVQNGESVTDYIKLKTNNVFNFAVDEATIADTYQQLEQLNQTFNNSNTFVFVSSGGNNILNSKAYLKSTATDDLFQQYSQLIQSIKTRLPNARLFCLNLYYPANSKYKPYHITIDKWNQLVKDNEKLGYKVIQTNKLLVSKDDFIYDIEPSAKGAKIIANSLLSTSGY
jgi:hypothetical protein